MPPPAVGRRVPEWLRALAPVLAGTALIAWHGSRFGHWIVDDAAITFAYARNVAEGNGPVLQPGADPTEGFSNPSWLALLSLGRLIGLFDHGTILGVPDYVLFPKALALLCCAGLLAACHLAARRVTRLPGLVTLATGALLAANPSFVIWCLSGLENALFALAVTALAATLFSAVCADRDGRLTAPRTALAAGGLAALAALTRPDGLVYVAAYPGTLLLLAHRGSLGASARAALISVATFAVPFGGYLAWRSVRFGELLSLPALAKNQDLPELADLARTGDLVSYVGAPAAITAAVLVGAALMRPSPLRAGLVPLLVTGGLAAIAYAVLKDDWMGQLRFATPVWAVGAFTAALAGAAVLRHLATRARAVLVAVLALALAVSGSLFATASQEFRASPTVAMCGVAERFGRTFNAYAGVLGVERGSLALPDVGGTALTSRLDVVDLAGLTHARIAGFWSHRDWAGLRDYLYEEARPTFLHAHGFWSRRTGVLRDERLRRDYVPVVPRAGGAEDWVRRDAVPGPAALARLRDYARDLSLSVPPRGHCGAVLRPGQLPRYAVN
ncbi:hypothetical protein B0I33_11576 [Prauserella shujinwangii]|uniref:4-amino-4-deoxy-L-arabinose transferase-like glycosyltransferase n=1 Tax=Prauserella shujinwangii TaxID=1453103 RepID=A0A2T0LKN6_9PSEU|nr:hypothetical protein B0I33_11576 [Prauserella shujinwangii]